VPAPGSPLFSSEQVALYEQRYQEEYDLLDDPSYVAWIKIYHPDVAITFLLLPPHALSGKKQSESKASSSLTYTLGSPCIF